MTDQLVRSAFHKSVLKTAHQSKETFVVDELGLKNGCFRADISVLNGKIIGYEIKTANDTLSRLASQVEAYGKIFNEAFLIVAEKHFEKALKIIPEWWGVYLIRQLSDNTIQFDCFRKAKKNSFLDSYSIAQLLWKDEALEVANSKLNYNFKVKTNKNEIYDAISTSCKPDKLGKIVINYLKNRDSWRKDQKEL